MKIIGQSKEGFFINATKAEVEAILNATGVKDATPKIGDNLPAYDYSAVITKCKDFKKSYEYRSLKENMSNLNFRFLNLTSAIDSIDFEKE